MQCKWYSLCYKRPGWLWVLCVKPHTRTRKGRFIPHSTKNVSYYEAAENLANMMFRFIRQSRRDRIAQRNKVEAASVQFDWNKLGKFYMKAYGLAMKSFK